jgi:hypothetical protein
MARLTLRVPDSLHDHLAERAKSEGVSMNQYLVFALSRIAAADEVSSQRAAFERLLQRYGDDEAEAALRRVLDSRGAEEPARA